MFRNINILIVMLALASGVSAQDDWINHPIKSYRSVRVPPPVYRDSVAEAIITFDPMPVYMQPSKVSIEYYSSFETEADIEIRPGGNSPAFTLIPPELTLPGPIAKGDTIRAEFTVIPRVVGTINLLFRIFMPYGPVEYDGKIITETSPATLNAQFSLGADGTLMAMNSYATGKDYAPFLGPLPEAMGDSLMFFHGARIDARKIANYDGKDYKYRYFSNEMVVYTQPDDSGYRHVKCTLSPLHAYSSGVRIEVSGGPDIKIKEVSPPMATPIQPGDEVEYTFNFVKSTVGISYMSILMIADNPEIGVTNGEIGHGDKLLIERMPLFIAYDENMNLLFITYRDPYASIPRMLDGRFHTPVQYLNQKDRDPRISWVEEVYKKNR